MKNILVTGGTGFVGSWVFKKQPKHIEHGIYLCKKNYEQGVCFLGKYDYIIHLAPTAPTEMLKFAGKHNARLLYASSGAVYHPEYQDKEYRENKMRWERECLDSGVDVVIARLFTFMDSSRAWNAIFNAVREGRKPQIAMDCIRSFMHGAEMARWMWAILLKGESGQAYDVGSDRAISLLQLGLRIQSLTGCEFEPDYRPYPMPVYFPENTAKTKALL